VIIGETALSETDRAYLDFGRRFERELIAQRMDESRSIGDTLDLAWQVLSRLPAGELTRLSEQEVQRFYLGKLDHGGRHG
jgi:V/A-type H+-transporting ATPase subunit B